MSQVPVLPTSNHASGNGVDVGVSRNNNQVSGVQKDLSKLPPNGLIHALKDIKARGEPLPQHVCVADFMHLQQKQKRNKNVDKYEQFEEFLNVLGQSANLNEFDSDGLSPLHIALELGRPNFVMLLLSRGADPNIESRHKQTPLASFATRYENRSVNAGAKHLLTVFEFHTYAQLFPHDAITLRTHALPPAIEQGKLKMTVKDFPARLSHLRYVIKNIATSPDARTTWIHVHSTNNIILARISDIVIGMLKNNIPKELIWSEGFPPFGNFPKDQFSAVGDPILRYRHPLFKRHTLQFPDPTVNDRVRTTSIVFPCLKLRSVKYQLDMREKVEKAVRHFPLRDEPAFQGFNTIHLERTLDEAYYPGLSRKTLEVRNKDQIVRKEFGMETDNARIPILTVPQLWIWQVGNFVLSAFASEYDSQTSLPIGHTGWNKWTSPEAFMGFLIAKQVRDFGNSTKHDNGDDCFPPTLSIFESAVVSTLSEVDSYMERKGDNSFDEDMEHRFIHTISDVRSELAMIRDVLCQQVKITNRFLQHSEIIKVRQNLEQRKRQTGNGNTDLEDEEHSWQQIDNALRLNKDYIDRTDKIDRDAERIGQVIQEKLNLRRTAASIKEALDAKLLSLSALGFTLITFIFTPLSFIATLLALDVDWFSGIKQPVDATEIDGSGSESYSGRKVIGIFIGVEFLSILITIVLGYVTIRVFKWIFAASDPKKPARSESQTNNSKRTVMYENTSVTSSTDTLEETTMIVAQEEATPSDSSGKLPNEEPPSQNGSHHAISNLFRRKKEGWKDEGSSQV